MIKSYLRRHGKVPRAPATYFPRSPLRLPSAMLLLVLLQGCSTHQAEVDTHENLNAALWTQTAVEYEATTLQAYRLATSNLDRALLDPHWAAALEQGDGYAHLPPAVILDLDQTVLDTSHYNARIIREYGSHSQQHFAEWCDESEVPAIPGAKDFVDHAVARGVAVFYNSARREALRDCTTRNLRTLGLPLPRPDRLLLNDGTPSSSKTMQRARVVSRYRVLLLVGDDLNDFVSGAKSDSDKRRALAGRYAGRWGREWIILPNPMYGSWESSLYGFDYRLPRDERLDRLLQQLEQ